jgi:lipopolysaccharide/colanic/teichoic acid biosynthesis glycosyltransferase
MSSAIMLKEKKLPRESDAVLQEVLFPICNIRPAPFFSRKIWFDRVLAALLLAPALLLLAVAAVLIRLTSRGPIVFRQRRVGKNGKIFMLYKLRTMRQDAESVSGAAWSAINDPRATFIGRILRKVHLDELPQLFNVLKGEMSLVGPRPERPEFVYFLSKEISGYYNRLAVAPGITGLAQLNLPPDANLDDVRRKLVLDSEYIQRGSYQFDLRLLFSTFLRFFKIHAYLSIGMLGLARKVNLSGQDASSGNGSLLKGHEAPTPLHRLVINRNAEEKSTKDSAHGGYYTHKPRHTSLKPK